MRTDWGTRALGNRNIIADPRREEMKDVLDKRIKKRENFRPFAPSVMEEYILEWFECSLSAVPFTKKVYTIKAVQHHLIPAVVNENGIGCLQTVSKNVSTLYYKLITKFFELTGVPLLLNTSINEKEPIVNALQVVLNCF